MIAVDTSSLVAFFEGEGGKDVDAVRSAFNANAVMLPSTVLTEILSDPGLTKEMRELIQLFPTLKYKMDFGTRRAFFVQKS